MKTPLKTSIFMFRAVPGLILVGFIWLEDPTMGYDIGVGRPAQTSVHFQHSRVINRGIHENANNLPCTTTNATSSFISTTRGSNSVTGQFSKP